MISWLIIGGESGPQARPFHLEWARETIRQCKAAGVAVFLKQLGAKPEWNFPNLPNSQVAKLKHPKGGNPSEWPEDIRVREFPRRG